MFADRPENGAEYGADQGRAKTAIDCGVPAAAILLIVLTMNGLVTRLVTAADVTGLDGLLTLFGVSAIIWFALFALARIALDTKQSPFEVLPQDRLPYLAAFLCAIVPLKEATFLAVVCLPAYLLWTSTGSSARRRIAIIGLALGGPVFWGPLLTKFLGPEITHFETILIGTFSTLSTHGNVFSAADGSMRYVVAAGCSAMANVSLVFVITASLSQLAKIDQIGRLGIWMALGVLAVIAVNSARLLALGYFPDQFEYLHEGPGRQLFGIVAFILISGLAMIGTLRALDAKV